LILAILVILRNFLNKLIWDNKSQLNRENFDIVYIHRGAPGDHLKVNCAEITKVFSDSFEYFDKHLDEKKRIPFHRIERILDLKKNEVIYQKTEGGS